MRMVCAASILAVALGGLMGTSPASEQGEVEELLHKARQLVIRGEIDGAGELCMKILLSPQESEQRVGAWELVRLLDAYEGSFQHQYANYARGWDLMEFGFLDEARITLEGISPASQHLDIAIAEKLAHIALLQGDYEQAVELYQGIYESYPQSESAPWALYHQVELLSGEGNETRVEKLREFLLERYPDSVPAQMLSKEDGEEG